MSSLPGWISLLLDRINWGCSTSPWFVDLADENKVKDRGRNIILALWPYMKELPVNIAAVREVVPESMQAARNLLGQLADDERHYQKLFKQQFDLTELSLEAAESTPVAEATFQLCRDMSTMCQDRSHVEGIYAVVAAELAATMYCRASLPSYERYFEKHRERYGAQTINDGLAWLRLHAKTHTRHAIWMKRMLCDIDDASGNEVPEAAELILNDVLRLWECPSEDTAGVVVFSSSS